MLCPNFDDARHIHYEQNSGSGPRGFYPVGHTQDGREVFICADCGTTFDEEGTVVRPNVSVIDEDDLSPRSLKTA